MNYALATLVAVDWLEVLRSLAPVATAGIAFAALRNWRRQDKAKREVEFLNELIETTHTYIIEMYRPQALTRLIKIGMESHVQSWAEGEESEKALQGAITYIQKNGERDGKRLNETLAAVEPSVVRLRSLFAKGQIFQFPEYHEAQAAILELTGQHNRLRALSSLVESPTWNWEHPEVRSLLVKVMAIDPDEVNETIGKANEAIISFVRATYERLYGRMA